MNLITTEQQEILFKNGSNPDNDHSPVIRLFMSNTACTWLISEMYTDQAGLAFGLCDLGFGSPELGYCYLPEMEESQMPDDGVFLQRDENFTGKYPMSAYAAAARAHSRVIIHPDIVSRYCLKPAM